MSPSDTDHQEPDLPSEKHDDDAHQKGLLDEIVDHIRFFSRIPVPGTLGNPHQLPNFEVTARSIPFAGLFIALGPALLLISLLGLGFSGLLSCLLAISLQIILTGALHEDGLADIADGFWGGATVERRLDIMKDSRVGTFGICALLVVFSLKVALLRELTVFLPPMAVGLAYLGGAALSRGCMVWIWYKLPNARDGGLSSSAGQPTYRTMFLSLVWTHLILIALFGWINLIALIIAVLCCALATLTIAKLAMRKIGGQTGDVMGATQLLAELAYLFGLLIVFSQLQ